MPALLDTARGVGVVRLRVRDADTDTGDRVRRGVERARPEVRGLPHGAIVVVRSMRGPAPPVGAESVSVADERWAEALSRGLEAAVRGAARPWHGPVPAACEAVLFTDRAEMLACLARDAAGVGLGAWWWASLGAAPHHAARGLWRTDPFDVPAAIELVATRGLATPVARWLGPAVCATLAEWLATTFGVDPRTLDVLDGSPRTAPVAWLPPEAGDPALHPDEARLVGVALMLRRAQASVRRIPEAGHGDDAPTPRPTTPHRPQGRRGTDAAAVPTHPPSRPGASTRTDPPAGPQGAITSPRVAPEPPPGPVGATADPAPVATHAVGEEQADTGQPTARVPAVADAAPGSAEHGAARGPGVPTEPAPPVASSCAGVMFLVNVVVQMGLFADLDGAPGPHRDMAAGTALWDMVALVGGMLAPVPADPVWDVLALLAGRDLEEPPDRDLHPPCAWRVPRAWTRGLAAVGAWTFGTRAGRLTVRHPGGLVAADVPAPAGPPAPYARLAVARLRPAAVRPGWVPLLPALGRERWVALLAGAAAAWLTPRLRATGPAQAAATLLMRPGRIRVTASRVDVEFPLDDHPFAIRAAALDRDPGPLPAAGRRVAFHFT